MYCINAQSPKVQLFRGFLICTPLVEVISFYLFLNI
jgi:hypothetical protein